MKEAGLALQGAAEGVNLESTGFIIAVNPSVEKRRRRCRGQQDQLRTTQHFLVALVEPCQSTVEHWAQKSGGLEHCDKCMSHTPWAEVWSSHCRLAEEG